MNRRDGTPQLPGGPMGRKPGFSTMQEVLRRHPEITRYLKAAARALYSYYADKDGRLSAPKQILVDRLLAQLAVARAMESYIDRAGLVRQQALNEGRLEAHGMVAELRAQNNLINRTVGGLEAMDGRPEKTGALTPLELLAEVAREEDEAAAAEKGADPGQGEAGPAPEPQDEPEGGSE